MQPCPTRPHCCYQTGIDNFFELNSVVKGEIKKKKRNLLSLGNLQEIDSDFPAHTGSIHTLPSADSEPTFGLVSAKLSLGLRPGKAACYPGVPNDRLAHRFVTVRNFGNSKYTVYHRGHTF